MSEEEELSRVYTINLSKVVLSPMNRRTKRAINMIKEFATHHMKAEEIKIDEDLNKHMWQRGIRHPPRKVRVKMVKDEDDIVTVSLYSEEAKEEVVEEKPKTIETAAPSAPETVAEVPQEKPEEKLHETKLEGEVEEAVEITEQKQEPEKQEEEPEKIVLSEEELEDIIAEEMGEGEKKESKKRK